MLGLIEVQANFPEMKVLRKWFRKRGYDMAFQVGLGSGSRSKAESFANGLVIAVDTKQAKVMRVARPFERVLSVCVRDKATMSEQPFTVMHGLHTRRFGAQLQAAIDASTDGLLEATLITCRASCGTKVVRS